MKFTNLRLVGFKSFVDTTDFDIRDGLTGIVGPNGCGKSNLLEALRWVMGATSAKALRGGGMADVVFAGTTMRPARNWAEVTLTLDNADRTAPAEYNDFDTLEVSRRIIKQEDGTQSVYRINAKEVRAKDVQLLFADASTGANSPALVRQGQISELINAKPENRRRLLEEAAGITGLHSRRHEAELRLRAAEQNLERLEDVTGELEMQKTALARQARQATRYRNLSGDIRRAEATAAYLRWKDAGDALGAAERNLAEIAGLIEETSRAAALASTNQTSAHEALDPLRMNEANAAAALHRLTVSREGLDDEARRAEAELSRLNEEIERLSGDMMREEALLTDARDAVATLAREAENLSERERAEKSRLTDAEERLTQAQTALEAAEQSFEEKSVAAADAEAQRKALVASLQNADQRLARIANQISTLEAERARVTPSDDEAALLEQARTRFAAAEEAAAAAEAAFHRAEEDRAQAEENERAMRAPREKATQHFAELKAEADAINRVLAAGVDGDWPALIESIGVEPGMENALAAALGDDLDASLDPAAPSHWRRAQSELSSADLPDGATPLSRFVTAPPELRLRLSMIGVVAREQGERLAAMLAHGQRLVSREGDLWRWDGFVARAEAKTAAAIRLEQRNRLALVAADMETAQTRVGETAEKHAGAQQELARTQNNEREVRTLFSDARRAVDQARAKLSDLQRDHERTSSRLTAIGEALTRASDDRNEAQAQVEELKTAADALPDGSLLAEALSDARDVVARARTDATEARAAHNDLSREAAMRARRIEEIARERGVWTTRGETAETRMKELAERRDTATTHRETAAKAPETIEEKRKALLDHIANAEQARKDAADALADAINTAQQADKTAKAADNAASEAREARARFEAQQESAAARVEEAILLAQETCSAAPEELLGIAEIKDPENLPAREDIDRKLERYKRERETLGGVNLRADEELQEITERLEEIAVEREDCEAAIRKLRAAIGSLNREARERLKAAFETVNSNFSTLFTRLFNGGHAELRMIESDDVLEAGLEIYASPPGKKLASMSLMSGGEQALTATALIFAVFMANPAPVCVLDEVDAPLDDANTERFCRLLNEMVQQTQTRFIIITHHALTMSRMDRLFGVTMIERGVSQLVSVDLGRAEQLAAAE